MHPVVLERARCCIGHCAVEFTWAKRDRATTWDGGERDCQHTQVQDPRARPQRFSERNPKVRGHFCVVERICGTAPPSVF
eukprot:8930327-Pyramimonas_sp.AAC.1